MNEGGIQMDNFNIEDIGQKLGMNESLGDIKLDLKVAQAVPVIEDIIVINAGRKNKCTIPDGYEKIEGDLNEGAGGDYIYLAVKYGTNADNAINGLAIVAGKNDKIAAPANFEKINQDLNKGAGGKYIYLCKHRGKEKPIREVKVIISKTKVSAAQDGYTLIGQDLNEGAGGKYIYLCYRQ
jgi:hypothetical protein